MRRRFPQAIVLVAWLSACDGQLGCVSCGDSFAYPDPPPPGGEIISDAALGQLQESGLRFFASHLSDILRASFPTRTVAGRERVMFYTSELSFSGGGFDVTLRDGCIGPTAPSSCPAADSTYRSRVELALDTLDDLIDARFVIGSDAVRVTLTDLDVFLDLATVIEVLGTDATCWIRDDGDANAAVHLDSLAFTITLAVDPAATLHLDVSNVSVAIGSFGDSSLLNLDVSACDGSLLCSDTTCTDGWLWPDFECDAYCGIGELIFSAADFFANLLSPLLNSIAPALLETALDNALAEVDGSVLAVSGNYDLAALFAGSGSLAATVPFPTSVQFGAKPNQDTFRLQGPPGGRGMLLALDAGFSAAHSMCAPTVAPPNYQPLLASPPFFDGRIEVDDPGGGSHLEAYDLALLVSAALAQQVGFGFYEAGSTCLVLDPETLATLSGGALTPTLGALALLAPGLAELGDPEGPVYFELHPYQAPIVRFGAGTPSVGGASADPLLHLDLGEVGLSIWAHVDLGFVRLATVAAEASLGLSVVRDANNVLVLGLEDLAVDNFIEVYDEYAPSIDFGELAEVVLSLALGGLVADGPSFDLDLAPVVSNLLGGAEVYARINAVRREGDADAGYLTVYVTFCDADDLADPAKPPCYTPPGAQRTPTPPRLLPRTSTAGADSGRADCVEVLVDDAFAYRGKVGPGPESALFLPRDGVVRFCDPRLRLGGAHPLRLRTFDRRGDELSVTVLTLDR